MADILICAKEGMRAKAERVATALHALRVEVDLAIDGDAAWDAPALDAAARGAGGVLVMWSNDCFPHGGDIAGFVRRAAAVGRKRGVLVSTLAEPTALDPPWNEKQAKSLMTWVRNPMTNVDAAREWLSVVTDIGALLGRPGLAPFVVAQDAGSEADLRGWAKANAKDPLARDVWAKAKAKEAFNGPTASRLKAEPSAPEAVRAGARARRKTHLVRNGALTLAGMALLGGLGFGLAGIDPGPADALASDAGGAGVGGGGFGLMTVVNVWDDWTGRRGSFGAQVGSGDSAAAGGAAAPGAAPATVTVMHGDIGRPANPAGPTDSLAAPTATPADAGPLIVVDARSARSRDRAPIVRDPARLPDLAAFRECDGCPEMVIIPAGTFAMGSPAVEAGRREDEDNTVGPGGAPVQISVPRFALARFETTWDEWGACVAAGACDNAQALEAGGHNGWGGGRRPVIEVNGSEEPAAFAAFVSSQAGGVYRLPSEAEWEYAARAGGEEAFPWGPSAARTHANYGDNVCCTGAAVGADSWLNTSPVGSFPANPFGLFDMHGNVMEWTADCYRGAYAGQPANAAPFQSQSCGSQVLRGGSWDTAPEGLRSAVRMRLNPERRFNFTGFRLARSL